MQNTPSLPNPSRPFTSSDTPSRRAFLYIATAAMAGVGTSAALWPLINQMQPDASVIAAGVPIDIDISQLEPGQQMRAIWRGMPVYVVNRSQTALAGLQNPQLLAMLRDPQSSQLQQPPYTVNWHRSIKPEFLVLVGICTHLGCLPEFKPDGSVGGYDGYFCPCHGSKYDLAGRVFSGVPAPYNLPVPPHRYVNDKVLRIGENPDGQTFDFGTIEQV